MPTSPATVNFKARDDLSWRLNSTSAVLCPVCVHYLDRRIRPVVVAVVAKAIHLNLDSAELLRRYMGAVHQRHEAGGCLSTRPHTPRVRREVGDTLTVQRACNGCGTSLGDARTDELDAATAGRPLPDVRLECGCLDSEVAA